MREVDYMPTIIQKTQPGYGKNVTTIGRRFRRSGTPNSLPATFTTTCPKTYDHRYCHYRIDVIQSGGIDQKSLAFVSQLVAEVMPNYPTRNGSG
jgi:hypothetical protein